jgi:O-antigen/teichoic acid export membrane protein
VGMIENAFRAVPMALQRFDISSKVGVAQATARSIGLVLLAIAHFGVLELVVWEVFVACMGLTAKVLIARRMLPGLRCLPSMSLEGIREIIGYSMYSFATHVFLTIWREGPKLLLGNRLGTASVAYLGTPDNVSHRLHTVVVSAVETLMPRFSSSQAEKSGEQLLMLATWSALALGAVLYVPVAVLMPDLLRLWINPAFALQSGLVGQLLVFGLISPSAYAPIATLFRGIGRPAFVTTVMALCAVVVLAGSVLLMPSLGVVGVAWAYVLCTAIWFGGLVHGWLWFYGRASLPMLIRVTCPPLAIGCIIAAVQLRLRDWWGDPSWMGLMLLAGSFVVMGAVMLLAFDLLLGGKSPAKQVLARVVGLRRLEALCERLRFAMWHRD